MKRRALLTSVLLLGLAVTVLAHVAAADWRALGSLFDATRITESGSLEVLVFLRLPRALLAVLVGGGLGVSAVALQAMARTPLADPHLLGLSGGAGAGALAAIALQGGRTWATPLAAVLGAAAAAALLLYMALSEHRRADPRLLVLIGVLLGAFSAMLMSVVLILSRVADSRSTFLWLFGALDNASWWGVKVYLAVAGAPIIALMLSGRTFDLLTVGDDAAHHLGVSVDRVRLLTLAGCAMVTGAGVAIVGVVGFVGVLGSVLARWFLGGVHARLLLATFVASGAVMALADVVAQTLASPRELPLGVVPAVLGLPMVGVLLRQRRA